MGVSFAEKAIVAKQIYFSKVKYKNVVYRINYSGYSEPLYHHFCTKADNVFLTICGVKMLSMRHW